MENLNSMKTLLNNRANWNCLKMLLIVLVLSLITANSMVYAGIIYVKHDASGTNDGSSWENAFTDMQSAFTDAVSGDQIWVAAGT